MAHDDYGEDYYRDRELWLDSRVEMEATVALARPTAQSRVLEVGCGGGGLLRWLAGRVRLAVGVDLSPTALSLARRRARPDRSCGRGAMLLCARAESLPFAAESFDVLVAQHLLEHLPEPAMALREWRRVLRPGGLLALVTPNGAYPDPDHFADPGHATLFTSPTLRSALEGAGFRVLHLSTLFPYLGRGRLARALSIRLSPLARCLPGLAPRGRSIVAAATR